jgi:hypothetical protein
MSYEFFFSGINVAAPAMCLKRGQHPSGHHSPRLYLQGEDVLYGTNIHVDTQTQSIRVQYV